MEYEVLTPFTWNGKDLTRGARIDLPDQSPRIAGLARAKFIRFPGAVELTVEKPANPAAPPPAQEKQAVPVSVATVSGDTARKAPPVGRDPKEVVRKAKANAAKKK